jgi:23S rRNA (uracil1939-C5)-methyltransferase
LFAVEESSSACADFEVNLEAFVEISLYEASVGAALPAIDVNADIVLVDPPRSGLSRAALDAILKHLPERLAYLSCDLGTLARDAKRLQAGGYELERVKPIDLFPQTFHIETLSSWRRR